MKLLAREDITPEYHAMLGEYLSGLNQQFELNGDPRDPPLTFGDFWIPFGDEMKSLGDEVCDPPRLMLDTAEVPGYPDPSQDHLYAQDRIIIISCTPFHDEGGPATLTAWFNWDDGLRWEPTPTPDHPQVIQVQEYSGRWVLDTIVQEFDTFRNIIYTQGELVVS